MDDRDIDPALEAEMNAAARTVESESLGTMANHLRRSYNAFRNAGFNRRQSFSLSAMFYAALLSRAE